MKIWLIQNVVSPYRIDLFKKISEGNDVDFKLILLVGESKSFPQWKIKAGDLPFKAELLPGFGFYSKSETKVVFNPRLFIKMLFERPDVIICAGYSFATIQAMFYRLLGKGHYLIWSEGTHITEGGRSKFKLFFRKIMIKFAAAIVDAGTLSRKYVRSLSGTPDRLAFFRSYNCVDNKKFDSLGKLDNDAILKLKEIYPDNCLMFVGQLVERKGLIQLCEVYKRLTEQQPQPVGLILIGDGPLRGWLEEFKAQHGLNDMHLLGFLPNDELPKYYAFCKAFMLLSLKDPNPLVIFEGLAAGIPIICSNRAGNAVDFIQDGRNGYVVDPLALDEVFERTTDVLAWENREDVKKFSNELVAKANYEDSAKAFIDACRFALRKDG